MEYHRNCGLSKEEWELEKIVDQIKSEPSTLICIGILRKALRIHDVVGRSEQLKAFADYAQKRIWEDGDKDLSDFVDEFLRL